MKTPTAKLIVLAAALPFLTLTGCDWGKKKPAATAEPTPISAPSNPTPYQPVNPTPMGNGGMTDANPSGPIITPLDNTPPVTPKSPTGGTVRHNGKASTGGGSTVERPSSPTGKLATGGSAKAGSTYTVKSGDSLSTIASKTYGKGNVKKGVAAIKKANGLKSDTIRVGQKLKLPAM